MLGAMNFGLGLVFYVMYKTCSVEKSSVNNTKEESNNGNNNKPNKKWKFNETILHAFEVAKKFILSGKKPTSSIINKLLGTKITDKDLTNLLSGSKHNFKDLRNHKKVIATITNLGKLEGTLSGIYI